MNCIRLTTLDDAGSSGAMRPWRARAGGTFVFVLGIALTLIHCESAPTSGDHGDDTWRARLQQPATQLSDAELRTLIAQLTAERTEDLNADPIADARAMARLSRVLTRRSGDVSHVQKASSLLADVATSRAGKAACEALLERAQLLLIDLAQLVDGERAARDITERFAEDAAAASCVREARAIAESLADQPAVIAAAVAASRAARATPATTSAATTDIDNAAWIEARSAEQTAGEATLERVTVYGGRAGARVIRAVLYFDHEVAYRRGEAKAESGLPPRLFLDFDAVKLAPSVEATVPIGQGGLQRVRVVDLDARSLPDMRANAGRVRVSFDVDPGIAHRVFFLSNPYRVVIDLQAPEPASALSSKVRTIVLDAGHGGHNTGAHGPHGLREAVVALDLTRRVRALLRHELPTTRVVLTRETNVDLSLEERTAIANGENAQLFVSIHLNAWATTDQGGVATFVLDTSDDSQALRLAARENGTEIAEVSELQKVLAGLYRSEQVGQSLKLAEAIHQHTLSSGRAVLPKLTDRGVKRAMFYVLVGATMPAVLVEPSFITHPDEAQALTTDAYRDRLAQGIAAGIVAYARTL